MSFFERIDAERKRKVICKSCQFSLFIAAWFVFIAGATVASAAWALLYRQGYKDQANIVELIVLILFTGFAIVLGFTGLFRWSIAEGRLPLGIKYLLSIVLTLLSIPSAILIAMTIALIISSACGVDPKTGRFT